MAEHWCSWEASRGGQPLQSTDFCKQKSALNRVAQWCKGAVACVGISGIGQSVLYGKFCKQNFSEGVQWNGSVARWPAFAL